MVVAPFVTLEALQYVVERVDDRSDLQVVARWRGQDLLSGASDVEIYPYLKRVGIPLFVHPNIHLKLLIFDNARAFHSSGNITRNGLGLDAKGNVEVGCDVILQTEDWKHLHRILAESMWVDDHIYKQAKEYVEANQARAETSVAPKLQLKEAAEKDFSWLSLPATTSPDELWHYYSGSLDDAKTLEIAAAASKDLLIFSLSGDLDESNFHQSLKANFRAHPFVQKFVEALEAEGSLRFGFVRAWLQQNCSDKPQPYRRDLDITVRNLYNWLQYYYGEVTWDQPRHSMVIYWEA